MGCVRRAEYLRNKAAEYRRRAHSIEHPETMVAQLLATADNLDAMAARAEQEPKPLAETRWLPGFDRSSRS